MTSRKIVTKYAQMWPREVFDLKEGKKLFSEPEKLLDKPGVYVLYRDDHPYYIGKTKRSLYVRLKEHAIFSRDKYYNFWNYFSAFVVQNKRHIGDVEGILIASMPTAVNGASPKIKRITFPKKAARKLREGRIIKL